MSIRKHKTDPNKWIIDYRPKGKYGPRHQIVYEGTELEAREVEGELRRRHVSATEHRVNPPINRILPEYLDWLKLHRATRTYQDLVLSLKWLQPIFGSLPVSRITRTTVQQYQQSRNGCTGRTINKELSYLSSIIKWMCDRNLADPLPFKIEKLPHRRPLPKIPHPAELKKFMSHFDGEKRAMVLLLFLSGLRFSEMSHLKWEDILWAQKTIRLQGKGGKWRFADLPDQVAELLKPLRKDEGFVFINPETEKPYGSMKTTFKTASKKAGAKITPHLLRHACATYLLEATGDLRLVQETLGHSSVAVTEFYTHITAGRIKNGLARSREHIKKLEDEIDTGPETPTPPLTTMAS